MKTTLTTLLLAMASLTATAQTDDPIVMRINGQPITRSEFEYNYNKNNTDGVIDRKTVEEYAQLFINYKLKVCAAIDAHLDTLTSYNSEFRTYRDAQLYPLLVTDEAMEREVHDYYDKWVASFEGKPALQPAHIFLPLRQQATAEEQARARQRIDSIYTALRQGADFAQLVAQCSQDPQTAQRGGVIGWIRPHQLLKEIEDVAYSMQVGEVAPPLLSPAGWHILKLMAQREPEPFDSVAPNIRTYFERVDMRSKMGQALADSLAAQGGQSVEQLMDEASVRFSAQDDELKYLIQEYHDGLLLFEVLQRDVWEPAAKDSTGMAAYFKAHKKSYAFDRPHFMGALLEARTPELLRQVQRALKGKPEAQWAGIVKTQFNTDSVQVRMEQRLFAQGDNAAVDSLVFGIRGGKAKVNAKYPAAGYVGRKLKKAPKLWTDVAPQVTADFQAAREQEFVDELRRRYEVEVYDDVLRTVNSH